MKKILTILFVVSAILFFINIFDYVKDFHGTGYEDLGVQTLVPVEYTTKSRRKAGRKFYHRTKTYRVKYVVKDNPNLVWIGETDDINLAKKIVENKIPEVRFVMHNPKRKEILALQTPIALNGYLDDLKDRYIKGMAIFGGFSLVLGIYLLASWLTTRRKKVNA